MDLTGLTEKRNRAGTRYYENPEGEVTAKECRDCGKIFSLEFFHRSKTNLAGRQAQCKKCKANRDKTYRNNNASSISMQRKIKYRLNRKDSEFVEKERERGREYYHRNSEKFKEYRRVHHKEISDYKRKWHAQNKHRLRYREARRIAKLRRRAYERFLPDKLTPEQYKEITEVFGEGCALTGSTKYHIDHVIPLSTGRGGTIYENIIPLRSDLNLSKSDQCIFDWFADNRERFGLSQQKFDELIEYLADINDMTVEEYEEYVRWCHDNPRSIDEVETELAEA